MATPLQIGVLDSFTVIFTLILVFVIMYGFLSITKPFGDKMQGLYALIGFAFAILAVTSKGVLTLISFMTPWFFVIIFVGFFILFVLMMFGLKADQIKAGQSSELRTWVIIFTLIILLFGLGTAFGQQALEAGTGATGDEDEDLSGDEQEYDSDGNPIDSEVGSSSKTATGSFGDNMLNTLVNPKVLGMVVVLLVGIFAMFLLTKSNID